MMTHGYTPQVAPAGYVEPLSTVSAGTLVEGRVTGVPAQVDWLVVHGWSMGGRESDITLWLCQNSY